jgi:hypothetical protein
MQITGTDAQPAGAEPCECCGTPVQVADVIAMARQLSGLDPADGPDRREFMEARTTAVAGGVTMQMRPHTRERCNLVRAGQPEPWDDPDDWDDDDWDDD